MSTVFLRVRNSVFTRLLMVFATTAIAVGLVVATIARIYFPEKDDVTSLKMLNHYMALLGEQMGEPPTEQKAQALANKLGVVIAVSGPDTEFSTGAIRVHPKAKFRQLPTGNVSVASCYGKKVFRISSGKYEYLVQSENFWGRRIPLEARAIMGFFIALIFVLSYLGVRRLFEPISWMKEGTLQLQRGNLAHRVPIRGTDELSLLSKSLNDMSANLDKMFQQKDELLLAISHDLRSPLTRAKLAVEMITDENEKKTVEDELNRMSALITDLLAVEKLKIENLTMTKSPSDVSELVQQLIRTEFSEGIGDIRVELEANGPVMVSVDPTRFTILARNLLENACRYSKSAVSVRIDNDKLMIIDDGPGIPEDKRSEVLEPFTRLDSARQVSTGGHGIGLYLVKLICDAHDCELKFEESLPSGLAVSVCWMKN